MIEIMKMMGMKMSVYWATHFIFNMLLYVGSVFVLLALGYAFRFVTAAAHGLSTRFSYSRLSFARFEIFVNNAFFSFFLLFMLWGWAMCGMAFCFTVLFGREFIATIISYIVVIVSWISGTWLSITALVHALTLCGARARIHFDWLK